MNEEDKIIINSFKFYDRDELEDVTKEFYLENKQLKEVIDKAINYIEWHSKFIFGKAERRFSDGKLECADGVEVFTGSPTKLLDILKEVK